jgi:hypothetical protein
MASAFSGRLIPVTSTKVITAPSITLLRGRQDRMRS